MRFLNPAALWLLLAVPILILIYLIRSQHEDTAVSSTYIWKLSSRFLKKRLPMQRMKKILLFVLQLLMIICAALMAARPAIANGNSRNFIAILDASASMNLQNDEGISRFDRAIAQIEEMTDEITQGHLLTVILAADDAYYVVRESDSVNETKIELGKLTCSMGGCNIEKAMELAQNICDFSEDPEVVFFTDHEAAETENISLVNLDEKEWDIEIESVKAVKKGKDTLFTVSVISHNADAKTAVGLKIDDKTVAAQIADCTADIPTQISICAEGITSFDRAEVFIEDTDGFETDNSYFVCPKKSGTYNVLLISSSPLYIRSALEALGNCNVRAVQNLAGIERTGYDLYIFDQIYTKNYPTDGATVQFGAKILPEGLTSGKSSEEDGNLKFAADIPEVLSENAALENTVVSEFTELIGNEEWTPVLTIGDLTVAMTRQQESGVQMTVFGFDVHDSNLPLQSDFTALMRNIVEYSAPSVVKETDYSVGDTVTVTAVHETSDLYIETPDEQIETLPLTEEIRYVDYIPETPGVYTAVASSEETGEYADFFVHIPDGEIKGSEDAVLKIAAAMSGNLAADEDHLAVRELWIYLAAAILFLLLLEWGIYYYEQR